MDVIDIVIRLIKIGIVALENRNDARRVEEILPLPNEYADQAALDELEDAARTDLK